MAIDQIAYLGSRIHQNLEGFGDFTRFCGWAGRCFFKGPRSLGRVRLLLPHLYRIGTLSIPVVGIVGAFVGMVLAVEAYDQFKSIGMETRLGGVINISVVRQIGPVLAAVMIAGRVGGAVSAELGSMRVTEQIDALKVLGTDPVSYLVVPRVLACLIMVPILTIFSNILGILGGYLITVRLYGVNNTAYWEFSTQFVSGYDVTSGLIKAMFFGLGIGLISTYKGFNCQPGAAGVGKAATESFVYSFVTIIILNLFLANFLKDLYYILYGYSSLNALG